MTVKDCGYHHDHRKTLYRNIVAALVAFVLLVLLTILLIFLILRPTKPKFILIDATVYAFNVSAPNFLTTTLQVTLSSRNPNDRVGVFYDRVDVYATYRGQQITIPTVLPPTYQGHKDVNVWSPFIYGNAVPVAPYLAAALGEDQVTGRVLLNVKVDGRVRWKVGTWVSGRYHLYVNCPAYIVFGGDRVNSGGGIAVGSGVKFQLVQSCHVDV
ncbi:NDR1/HIN1-like protein 1 [Rhododendron vialii]|uniref:NDR1/HIN1-like protein 1 n=1 Tax=Rhododendron vialii TaxID=182163 RepID=UPI00265DB736|nr:NDR1/HIN1-like protein 1 [Rhododendron vialii]